MLVYVYEATTEEMYQNKNKVKKAFLGRTMNNKLEKGE